jgi:hypothetical protein
MSGVVRREMIEMRAKIHLPGYRRLLAEFAIDILRRDAPDVS